MSNNFKSLGDVELLDKMPENANVIIEVDGATRRAPKEDGIGKLVAVESLEEVPEGATVLAEVDGEIKRVPSNGLGGGMLYDMPDVVVFTATSEYTLTCNKTFNEIVDLVINNRLNLAICHAYAEYYNMYVMRTIMVRNGEGGSVFDEGDKAHNIMFEDLTRQISFFMLNNNEITFEDPAIAPI